MKDWLSKTDIEIKKGKYIDAIDTDIQYIENYKQMKQAEKANARLSKLVDFCNDLINEMNTLIDQLSSANISTELQYKKGYYRINIDGKYFYRKALNVERGK